MSAWTCRQLTARPLFRLFHLVFESHTGRALVPSPKRSTSPRATSTLRRGLSEKRLTLTGRLEKRTSRQVGSVPIGNISTKIHLAIWLRRAPRESKANSARPKAAHKTAIYRNRAQSGVGRLMIVPNVVTGSEFQRK